MNYIETKKIATDFDYELRRIKIKFLHDGYSVKFINDSFFRFNEEKEELVIPRWLFDKTKSVVMILSFAPRYENFNKRFISKLQTFFTNDKISVNFIWSTCNNKDNKMQHLSCVVYKVFALVVQIILEN